jgi:hypothetical protein
MEDRKLPILTWKWIPHHPVCGQSLCVMCNWKTLKSMVTSFQYVLLEVPKLFSSRNSNMPSVTWKATYWGTDFWIWLWRGSFILLSIMFCWLCIVVYQYSETNMMHFLFSLLRIKGLYKIWTLLAHPQEALNKQQLVYCVCVMSVGCTPTLVQPNNILNKLNKKCIMLVSQYWFAAHVTWLIIL